MLSGHAALAFAMLTIVLLVAVLTNARLMEPAKRVSKIKCELETIEVIQVPTEKLPSGSQVFSVQILNECSASIRKVHLSCGSFHSELMISPRIFRFLGHNHCLANDGKPIPSGRAVSFRYASSTKFPLSVSSIAT